MTLDAIHRSSRRAVPRPAAPVSGVLPPLAVRRLFILRPDHLGDLVLFSGALRHLRHRWPAARITLCVHSFGLELFQHCPHVDALVSYDRLASLFFDNKRLPGLPNVYGAHRASRYVRRLFRGFLQFPYRCDLALLPVRSPRAEYHLMMQHLPACWRAGISGSLENQSADDEWRHRSDYAAQLDASKFAADLPELETTRRFLQFVGAMGDGDELWPEFWTTDEDRRRAEEMVPTYTNAITLGVSPGVSSVAGKHLPSEWFARVVERSGARRLRVVLLGSEADAEICAKVEGKLKRLPAVVSTLNLAGKTRVREFVECVRRCEVVLSQETATLHVATALRKPVAGIVGGGHFGRFFPWGDPATARCIHKAMECYGCNWRCHFDTFRCIQEIPSDAAAKELRELFSVVRRGRPSWA